MGGGQWLGKGRRVQEERRKRRSGGGESKQGTEEERRMGLACFITGTLSSECFLGWPLAAYVYMLCNVILFVGG